MRTDDEYLIDKCLKGEKAAFGFLVDKYKENVYAFAWNTLHNFHDAEDITQEAFIRAYRQLHTLRRWDNFLVWLRSITYNLCIDLIRQRGKRPDRDFIEEQDQKTIEFSTSIQSYQEDLMRESLHEALDSLPEIYREILTLHYLGGMKCKEIAQFLGKPNGTIKQYLSRARTKLKKEMIDIDIWTAAAQGNIEAIKQHLDVGTDINGTLVKSGRPGAGGTPLHIAVIAGQIEATKLLLEKGANINAKADDEHGGTPLHWAAFVARMDFVKVLLEAGADVNAKSKNAYTPLDAASHDAIANLICQHGGKTRSELISTVATSLRGVYSVNGELYINAFGTAEGKPMSPTRKICRPSTSEGGKVGASRREGATPDFPNQKITSGHQDMVPSWRREGGKIVFFRVTKFTPKVATWKTAICVINTDGTGFRQITDGCMTNYDPTWTRDGKNDIIFSRYDDGKKQSVIYRTTAESQPGEEVVISELDHSEFALSSLRDSRLFITSTRDFANAVYYLLTPKDVALFPTGKPRLSHPKDGGGIYEPVTFNFPLEGYLDQLSVAPSETKITYEYKAGWAGFEYTGKTLYIADFNLKTRTVSNPVAITDTNPCAMTMTLFPRWTKDESAVVYQSNKTGRNQLYMYRLKDSSTIQISTNEKANYANPCGEETPK